MMLLILFYHIHLAEMWTSYSICSRSLFINVVSVLVIMEERIKMKVIAVRV